MENRKLNCWEFKNCGREQGGANQYDLGVCAASQEKKLHGVHDGTNGGRACWVVAGTFCGGRISGSFAKKYDTCRKCNFYKKVLEENSVNFELTMNLMNRLKKQVKICLTDQVEEI